MKTVFYVLSVLLMITGIVWFLQGINILPGSFMTGDLRWAGAGLISLAIGISLYRAARRR